MPTKFAVKALMLVTVLVLTGCMTMGSGGETRKAMCDQFKPIRWSASDTAKTAVQAKEHNAVGVAICGWRP